MNHLRTVRIPPGRVAQSVAIAVATNIHIPTVIDTATTRDLDLPTDPTDTGRSATVDMKRTEETSTEVSAMESETSSLRRL
jgi:hypothetical protein